MVSRDLVPMRERMRPATMDRQAATDCGGWRAGHNGGDAAPRRRLLDSKRATKQRQSVERDLGAPHGLPLVTHQPLHGASFGAVVWSNHVWLLSGWPWVAVPSLTFAVVLLVLAGHAVVVSLGDGLV